MLTTIADTFYATANLRRADVFTDDRLTPTSCVEDAHTAAPGWVGPDWAPGGTLLVGINPGGGGDEYRMNPHDAELYGLIRKLRNASGQAAISAALVHLSAAWISIQATHSIRRVISAILESIGQNERQAAFMNVLPFRTRENKPARKEELRRAWEIATGPQVAALRPRRIVALGCKAYDALIAAGADREHNVILLKRAIGDSVITEHAKGVLAQLRTETGKGE